MTLDQLNAVHHLNLLIEAAQALRSDMANLELEDTTIAAVWNDTQAAQKKIQRAIYRVWGEK